MLRLSTTLSTAGCARVVKTSAVAYHLNNLTSHVQPYYGDDC